MSATAAMGSLQKIISAAMTEYPTCHAQPFVAGLTFSTALPAASQPAVPVATGTLTYYHNPPPGAVIVSTAAPNNNLGDGLTVTKIQIQPYARVNTTTFIVMLQVLAQRKLDTITGSNVFTANIPISVQATVFGASATITDCTTNTLCQPPNWSQVTTATDTFCINTTSTFMPAAGIFVAAANCAAQNAHLCSSQEWMEACNFAGPGFDGATPQWVAPIYTGCGAPGCYMLASNNGGYAPQCVVGGAGGAGFGTALNYRCCHR